MYGFNTFHEKIMEGLIGNVRRENPPHAYIFEGENGLNLEDSARLFAVSLACPNNNPPCTVCNSCQSAKGGNNPDIIFVVPEDKKKTIGVDRIRDLSNDAYIKPFLAKRKIYIFPDSSLLTEQAQNALLKLIEEPPEYMVFIFVSENSELLLETIRSRCVKVRFPLLPNEKIGEYIDKISPNDKRREFLINFSGGNPGNVDEIIANENFDYLREESLKKLESLFSSRRLSAYTVCDFLEGNKESAELILSFFASFVRDILFIRSGAENLIKNSDYKDEMLRLSGVLSDKEIADSLDKIFKAKTMLKRYVNVRAIALWLKFSIKK